MLNSVSFMGRFTQKPELHKTTEGTSVTSFTIANDVYGKDTANYIECVAWRGVAELICRNCEKGQMIGVHGKLQTREYENKNGERRKSTEVIVDDISFCPKTEKKENPLDIQTTYILNEDDLPY